MSKSKKLWKENQQRNTITKKALWKIRAKKIILCTGAIERPIVFPDNDLPGIMLAASVSTTWKSMVCY